MGMKQLYEYAIIKQERKNKDGEIVEQATILVEPTTVLAKSIDDVNVVASRAIPEEEVPNLDRLTIAVRPF